MIRPTVEADGAVRGRFEVKVRDLLPGDRVMFGGTPETVRVVHPWNQRSNPDGGSTVHFECGDSWGIGPDDLLDIRGRKAPEFSVIMADPAWTFRDKGSRIAPDSTRADDRAARSYSTMTTEEIAAMPVGELATPDAVLALWSTWAHLLDGSAGTVARAWGFEPVTAIPWIKVSAGASATRAKYASHPAVRLAYRVGLRLQIGAGHYTRAISEPLLLCTRKATKCVPAARRLPGVIIAPKPGGHSVKPPAARALIDSLYPDGERLEVFARGPVADGWWGHGYEAEGVRVLPRLRPETPRAVPLYECRGCGNRTARRTIINDVHDDARYNCPKCGHSWVTEGPDA